MAPAENSLFIGGGLTDVEGFAVFRDPDGVMGFCGLGQLLAHFRESLAFELADDFRQDAVGAVVERFRFFLGRFVAAEFSGDGALALGKAGHQLQTQSIQGYTRIRGHACVPDEADRGGAVGARWAVL